MAKTKLTTPDGKSFLITHKDGVSKDALVSYTNNVLYPRAAAEEAGPFDFIVDAFTVAKSGGVKGTEEASGGIQQGAANIVRYGANAYYNLLDDLYQDAENKERVKVARERTLRDINQYEDVGEMMREPVRKLAQDIRNSRFLEQDSAAANVALEVTETVARMAPVLASAVVTKKANLNQLLPQLTNIGQVITEAKRDMEESLGKKQSEFTNEERQTLADISSQYAAGSAILFKAISSPAIGLDKISGETLRKFIKGEIKLPAGKLKSLFNIVKAGGGEALEETAQGQFLDTLAAFSYDDERELVGKEVLNKRMHEAMIAFFAGGAIRTTGEVAGAIGNITLPTSKTQEVSEEQRKGMKTFKVKYTATQKEKGREDAVFDREDTFEASSLEDAQKVIDGSVKKKPGVDLESIIIEEVQPTETKVEPVVQEEVETEVDTETVVQEEVDTEVDTETVVDPVDPQETGAEIPIGVFGDVDLETVEGLTPQQKQKILELRQEANAEARKLFGALDDPTGELDAEAVAEGLKALQEISEDGTVGATSAQKQTLDKIREIERKMSVMIGREYIPRTDADIVGEIERTVINRTQQTGAAGALFPNLPLVGATRYMKPTSVRTAQAVRDWKKNPNLADSSQTKKAISELKRPDNKDVISMVRELLSSYDIGNGRVRVYRGAQEDSDVRVLSGWSLNPEIASDFQEQARDLGEGEITVATIPIKDVLYKDNTLFDDDAVFQEQELIFDTVENLVIEKQTTDNIQDTFTPKIKEEEAIIKSYRMMPAQQVFDEEGMYDPKLTEEDPFPSIVGATMSPVSSEFDSSRVGTAKQGTEARPRETSQDDNIDTSIVPEAKLKAQMDRINYAHLPKDIKNETDPRAKYEKFVEYMKRNLIALHDKFPEDLRAIATQWYDGARKLTEGLASKYNKTEEQIAGVLAVLSPQKQWFMNLAQGEQVLHILQNYLDTKLEGDAFEVEVESAIKAAKDADLKAHMKKKIAKRGFSKEQAKAVRGRLKERAGFKRRKILNQLKGKTIRQLLELDNTTLAGWGIRLLSQKEFGRYYNIVNPDGTIMGVDTKKDGTPAVNTWGAIGEIRKAISILENGSLENISENLGQKHKVRNFYNNIVAPNSPYGDTTIDTHAVAAGLLMPLGASATEVSHNFGSSIGGAPSIGVNGSYHMYLEAYRRAAREVGIQPRQMQSITWEAIRLLYPSEIRNKESVAKATKIHNNANNEQEARDTILGPAIPRPSWSTAGDGGGVTEIPASIQGFGSDNVLGGDLQFRGRRTQRDAVVGTTQQETQTKAERSVIGSAIAAAQKLSEKLGVKIEESNTINRPAQYNYETQTIQYNPQLLASRGKDFSNAAMREEIIHAAMHQVIMKRNPKLSAKAAFEKAMSNIGSDLTQEQKALMTEVYGDLDTDLNYGAEYTRFAVQHILDGKTTESTLFSGKAFEKVASLIKSVQSYVAKILGPELKTNEEAAFIIADTIRLLRTVDPSKKPAQQKIVNEAVAILSGTSQVDSYVYDNPFASEAQKKKRISETKRRNRAAVLQTASSFFKRIHGDIATLISDYYTRLERRQTDAVRQINNFQTRIRGIKNKKDSNRLKQLLTSTSDPNTADGKRIFGERDNLLRKYNLYNDFNLLIRPLLDQLRLEAIASGMDVKYLFEYFPMKVKDLGGLINLYGKDIENDFDAHIKKLNKKREDNKELQLNEDEIAAEFNVYLNNKMYKTNLGEKVPGFLQKRKGGMLSQEELPFYEDPEVALGAYVNSIIVKTEEARMFGNKALQRNKKMELDGKSTYRVNLSDPQGELSRLVGRLFSEGKLDKRQMGDLFFGLDQMFGPPIKGKEQESNMRQFGRLASYGSLLVDPTTTLSQLYDLAFMALDNPNVLRIAKTIFTQKDFNLEMAGIDPTLMSAEFRPNNQQRQRFLEKTVKFGLKSVGFTQLDKLMKETNLTVNYNRYRRISKRPKNSKEFKKFRSEVEFMVGPQDAERTINDFKNGVYDSPYVRELVVRKLLETQPVNAFEMPMAVRKNPNLRMWYTMKSFIIKQANLVNDRMISKILSRTSSGEEKGKAILELIYLIFLFQMAGIPIDFIKDMFAGRDVYPEDYVENAFFRLFGMSKYNMYILKERGPAEFGISYIAPVPLMQALEMSKQVYFGGKKVVEGEFETEDAQKIIRTLMPYDSLWYYGYGPGAKAQQDKQTRQSKERGRVPMIYGDPVLQFNPETFINLNLGPRETNISEPMDLAPYFRDM